MRTILKYLNLLPHSEISNCIMFYIILVFPKTVLEYFEIADIEYMGLYFIIDIIFLLLWAFIIKFKKLEDDLAHRKFHSKMFSPEIITGLFILSAAVAAIYKGSFSIFFLIPISMKSYDIYTEISTNPNDYFLKLFFNGIALYSSFHIYDSLSKNSFVQSQTLHFESLGFEDNWIFKALFTAFIYYLITTFIYTFTNCFDLKKLK